MGVDLRVHISFLLLLLISMGFSLIDNGSVGRGVALWLAMCSAVLVREMARSLAAIYSGLRLRALFLLPIGGLMAFTASAQDVNSESSNRLLTIVGPVANFGLGLLILGTSYGLEPQVRLLAQPWISTGHILRSLVWMQMILGMVSLLPMPVTPSRFSKSEPQPNAPNAAPRARSGPASLLPFPSLGLGVGLALAMIVAGFVLMNLWLIILGGFMMLGSQLSGAHTISNTDADSILVHQVMLTDYTVLSGSDTLQTALDASIHSSQDVFPVVRGDRLVGSVARQTIVTRLLSQGDSYLQGVMTRSLQLASPGDKLSDTLRRASALGAAEIIPVVENGAMIGILTSQSLSRAVQQIKLMRPAAARLQ
ncbi:MAG: CBS domain-containing protein [Acidobacteriaceae bacterium]